MEVHGGSDNGGLTVTLLELNRQFVFVKFIFVKL